MWIHCLYAVSFAALFWLALWFNCCGTVLAIWIKIWGSLSYLKLARAERFVFGRDVLDRFSYF